MIQAKFELDEFSNRVLDVIKGKYGFKNKNQALNKFFHLYGDNFIEPEFDEKEIMALRDIVDSYEGSKDEKNMTLEDLDKMLGI